MDALGLIGSIVDLGVQINNQIQTLRDNDDRCKSLAEDIRIVVSTVTKIEGLSNKEVFNVALTAIEQCLVECHSYTTKYFNKGKLKRLFFATHYNDDFKALLKKLKKNIHYLDLGLNAQNLVNQEHNKINANKEKQNQEQEKQEEKKIAEEERKEKMTLLGEEKELIKLLGQHLEEQKKQMKMSEDQKRLILKEQEESLKQQFTALKAQPTQASPSAPLPPHLLIPFYELTIEKEIGKGSFGKVYAGKYEGLPVAIKMIDNFTLSDRTQLIREAKIMDKLKNPNITTLTAVCLEPTRACIVMEYMEKGSLRNILDEDNKKINKFTDLQRNQMILDLCKGLQYLHTQNMLHRDLKSENVLVNSHGQLKLSDFGLAKTASNTVMTAQGKSTALQWMAPEILNNAQYTKESDIYSLGIIIWEILTNDTPFNDLTDNQAALKIKSGEHPKIPDNIPDDYKKILEACWNSDLHKRPELSNIINEVENFRSKLKEDEPNALFRQGYALRDKDLFQAARFYQQAANLGHLESQYRLGMLYVKVKNSSIGHDWLMKAAEKDHALAQVNLAEMLITGDGVKKDLEKGYCWLGQPSAMKYLQEKAAKNDKYALQRLAELKQSQAPVYQTSSATTK